MNEIEEQIARLEAVPGEGGLPYLAYHSLRYKYLMGMVLRVLDRDGLGGNRPRILDVGPSYQTSLLRSLIPDAEMETMGYYDSRFPAVGRESHIAYDLNLALDQATWPQAQPFDLVVMAEVIEHLHTAPLYVLRFVRSLVRPGGRLILQTPNAVALAKRLMLLVGKNPYEPIREELENPGHFCEYTVADLRAVAIRAGWEVEEAHLENYFGRKGLRKSIYELACSVLPGDLRDGITMVLRRRDD